MTKPTSYLDWAVGNPLPAVNVKEPSGAKKIAAFAADERPAYEFFNWLFHNTDEWIKYFEQQTDAFAAEFDLIIGSGPEATHANLQAAVDDGAVGSNQRVLVKENFTINTIIDLSKSGWRIYFAPNVTYTKGSVTTGIRMNAANLELLNGRFAGFSTGGDIAIEQLATAEYNVVRGTRFTLNTDTEVDQSAVPAGKFGPVSDTITEV